MNAIRIRTQINENHELILRDLPLSKGKRVEVIILEDEFDLSSELSTQERFPLRGKPIRYDDPFGLATDETDWEAIR